MKKRHRHTTLHLSQQWHWSQSSRLPRTYSLCHYIHLRQCNGSMLKFRSTNSTYQPRIHPDDEIVFTFENNDELHEFRFSIVKLEKRGCKGFLNLHKKHSVVSEASATEVERSTCCELVFESHSAHSAMRIFAEWVGTGKLRPSIKHQSADMSSSMLLYIIACELAHEILCNQVMDELIAYYEETDRVPLPWFAREMYKLCQGHRPHLLREVMLQYTTYCTRHLEDALGNGGWKAEGDFDRELLLRLTRKINGKSELIVPSVKTKCNYHLHQETQPCKK